METDYRGEAALKGLRHRAGSNRSILEAEMFELNWAPM